MKGRMIVMKIKDLHISMKYELHEKALKKLTEITEKLISEECIQSLASNVVNRRLHGRRSKTYETIQGLMYPIQFSKKYKEFYDEERNYIGEPQDIKKFWVYSSETNEIPTSEHIPDRYTYMFSNIAIRTCLSEKIEFLLSEDDEIRNDIYLKEIIKTILESALLTKSYWGGYDTSEKYTYTTELGDGRTVEGEDIVRFTQERKFFRLDFFLSMRNKTIAELMNLPLNMVSANTICEKYQYNKNDDIINKEKALIIAKTMLKNILDEIRFDDAVNILIINKKILGLDIDIEDFISLSRY